MAIELDYMEYADDVAAQAAYVSDDFEPVWDLIDEDCSDISDWVDADVGDGESIESPEGQFRFDCNTGTAANIACRTKDIGWYPNTFTYEIKLWHDAIGTQANGDYFNFNCRQVDERLHVAFCSDGLFIQDTDSGWTEVGANLVKQGGSAEWQTWRFVVTFGAVGDGVCDVYLKDSTHNWDKVGSAIPCSVEGSWPIATTLVQYGITTPDRISHVDYVKVATGLQPPNLICFSESAIKEQGSYSLKVLAKQTVSANDTLTRTVAPIDLSGRTEIRLDVRASRTGSQFKIGIHDVGGTTTEHTVNIAQVDTWQEDVWDISGVADANKDAIDSIIITIVNAAAENIFYIDDVRAEQVVVALPVTLGLALTQHAPGVVIDYTIIPSTFALVLTQHAPSVVIDLTVIPTTLALVLAQQTPTVFDLITILPSTLQLASTLHAPSLAFDYTVLPSVLPLVLTLQTSSLIISPIIESAPLALGLALHAPEVVTFYTTIPPFMHKDLIDPYSGGAWLWLVEISVPGYSVQRIARNTAPIAYAGENFPKGNFDPGKQLLSGDGSIPEIILRVAQNPDRVLENIINATKGGENGTVKLIRTCEKYLDFPVAELEAEYDILTAGSNPQWITFVLGIPNPLIQRIPLWLYSSKVCELATPSLFGGARCQYAGTDAICTGLLEDCRDNKDNAIHWSAEIGLDPNTVRV